MNEDNRFERFKAIAIVVIFFIILPSPALQSYLGIKSKPTFVASVLAILVLRGTNLRLQNSGRLPLVLSLIAVTTAIAWLWSTLLSQAMMGLTLVTAMALSWVISRASFTQRSVTFLYRFNVVILIGAWIGFFYAMGGGGPTFCYEHLDKSENCLYLTTFGRVESVTYLGSIRPAGFLDEPGSLSFFTVLVVCLNELCEGGRRRSIVLFSLGLITLSLAHAICFAAYTAIVFRRRIAYLALAGVLLAGPISGLLVDQFEESPPVVMAYLGRFAVNDDGLSGDNRSNQVTEFFSLVDYDITRYGNNAMMKYKNRSVIYQDQSSNPFSIWFGYGVIMWFPYLVTLVILARNFFARMRSVQVTAVLVFLLLLQRPYIYSLYWAFAIWSVIALMSLKKADMDLVGATPGEWYMNPRPSPS